MLGKALLKNGRASAHESAPDPLLSPFICNMSFSDPTGIPEDVCSDINAPITSSLKRYTLVLLWKYNYKILVVVTREWEIKTWIVNLRDLSLTCINVLWTRDVNANGSCENPGIS